MNSKRIIALLMISVYHSVVYSQVCPQDPRCINNPYGAGNPYNPDSVNNPQGRYGSKYSNDSANNKYATNAPRIYDEQGNYRGRLSNNKNDPDSISNPQGMYGNPSSGFSINNPSNRYQVYSVQPQGDMPFENKGASSLNHDGFPQVNARQALGAVIVIAGAMLVGLAIKAIVEGVRNYQSTKIDSPSARPRELSIADKRELGIKSLSGAGVEDYKLAKQYLGEAADSGDMLSQFSYATMYMEGRGVEIDYPMALRYFQLAAYQGHEPSQTIAADWLWLGKGGEPNYKEAVKLYELAAKTGNLTAAANLGAAYVMGQGTEQDLDKAKFWLAKAADSNNYHASVMLANLEYWGLPDGKPDMATAVRRFSKYGQLPSLNPYYLYILGHAYMNGNGVERNTLTAISYFTRAANKGFPAASYAIGGIFENGDGVDRDIGEAVKYYRQAADVGFPGAKVKVRLLERSL